MDILSGPRSWTTWLASVLVAIAPLFGFWKYYVADVTAAIQVGQSRLSELRSSTAQAAATAGRMQHLRSAVEKLEREVESFESAIPAGRDLAAFLEAVAAVAARSNLTVRRFAPQPTKPQSSYAEFSYKLQVDGRFQDLAAFFQNVADRTPTVGVRDLTISAKVQSGEGVLRAECVLSTFVIVEGNQPVPAQESSAERPPTAVRKDPAAVSANRDPFAVPAKPLNGDSRAERRPGLEGVAVDHIALKGIIRDSAGFRALLQVTDKRTFIVHAGGNLLDAVVKTVTADAIIFSRTGDERVAANRQQDVVRKLRPTEGDRR